MTSWFAGKDGHGKKGTERKLSSAVVAGELEKDGSFKLEAPLTPLRPPLSVQYADDDVEWSAGDIDSYAKSMGIHIEKDAAGELKNCSYSVPFPYVPGHHWLCEHCQ